MTSPKITPAELRQHAANHAPFYVSDCALLAAADRIEELERDEGIVTTADGLRCGPAKVTCLLLERDELSKELDAAKAAHADESGRWDEQHARQHAVNTQQAKELVAAKADLEQWRRGHDNLCLKISTLYAAIEHGDESHKKWLKERMEEHFNSRIENDFDAVCQRNAKLREALKFYADNDTYGTRPDKHGRYQVDLTPVLLDEGQRAKEALEADGDDDAL